MYSKFQSVWHGIDGGNNVPERLHIERFREPAPVDADLPEKLFAVKFYELPSFPLSAENQKIVAEFAEIAPDVSLSLQF